MKTETIKFLKELQKNISDVQLKKIKKVFSDSNVRRIDKREFVVSMSNEEHENLIDKLYNEDHDFFYFPKINCYAIKIEWRGAPLNIPAFETWAQARTFGLGQNEVITRTCRLDAGGTKEFYIPIPTQCERKVN